MTALRQIDQGIGSGVRKQHEVMDVIGAGVEGTVSEMVSTVTAKG